MSSVFFPFFLENDLLKVDKILGLTFLRQEKTWKDSIRRFSIYGSWVLCSRDCLQLPRIRVEEAVSWTQRFLTREFWLKNRSWFMTNKFKRKCLQKFYVSSKQEKEWYRKKNDTGRRRLTSSNRAAFLSALHAKNDTTNPFC